MLLQILLRKLQLDSVTQTLLYLCTHTHTHTLTHTHTHTDSVVDERVLGSVVGSMIKRVVVSGRVGQISTSSVSDMISICK